MYGFAKLKSLYIKGFGDSTSNNYQMYLFLFLQIRILPYNVQSDRSPNHRDRSFYSLSFLFSACSGMNRISSTWAFA
jgi:hypothetical protein